MLCGAHQDGYAVVAADGVGEYPVVGESRAGALDTLPMGPGRIVYITTGVCCLEKRAIVSCSAA